MKNNLRSLVEQQGSFVRITCFGQQFVKKENKKDDQGYIKYLENVLKKEGNPNRKKFDFEKNKTTKEKKDKK